MPSTGASRGMLVDNKAILARLHRLWQKNFYPIVLWIIVLGILLVISACHQYRRSMERSLAVRKDKENEEEEETLNGDAHPDRRTSSVQCFLRMLLSEWNILMYRRTIPMWWNYRMTIAEMLFCSGYLVVLLVLGLVDSNGLQYKAYANRCGHLATSQIPLIIGLAGKNNVISYLPGIGSEKLNVLHRAAGRSALVLALLHAYGRWQNGLKGHNAINTPRIIWGLVALSSFTLLTLMSVRPLRNKAYELFLATHIVLVFTFVLAVSYHRSKSYPYVLVGWVLWAVDRLGRCLRVGILNRLWLNFNPFWRNPASTATVELLSADTMRISMRRHMRWKPGQYAYLIMPTISFLVWESHPFTIASVSDTNGRQENELTFIVRARDGFTKRLLAHAQRGRKRQLAVECAMEGPYGCPPSLAHFSTAVLISGGSGVSYTLPQFKSIIHDVRNGRSATRSVCFIWVVRHADHISWISTALASILATAPEFINISIRIFVTQDSDSADQRPSKPLPSFPIMSIAPGRPDLRMLLVDEIERAAGEVSVNVCGPPSMTQTVRTILAEGPVAGPVAIRRGCPPVELHVETFSW
ncbi:hypothetical protein DACRYDRAFT_60933 [Dacryopinax primogenitus]|uniref:ferric-chelate reductase (NADPH) n=1 Tax=Dacryopinax primogenitus (strain DJM 731) TaxID=1858805 RepID=M5GGY1_DACPD|nr:uncharacterized protein DACRYDRAFT_60933 [Dacryopinax primogenitus]EJU06278.1 hypothetical protein DACRYDRAFT_60933 [Dacryopinax primogenitus]